jgi:ABC-type molybdate transport system substrate-binding protein
MGNGFMIGKFSTAIAATISSLMFIATTNIASAAPIKLLSGSAIETAMAEILPKFEQTSGHKVIFDFNGTTVA